jgi:LPXTG-motif cell wall-anchored protein
VAIKDFSFGPSAVTVHVGDTVTWSNQGPSPHTATGSGFDTGTLNKGQSGSHTFGAAGTFSYHCTIHPFMKGTVTVVASTASNGSSGSGGSTSTGSSTATGSGTTGSTAGTTSAATTSGSALPRTGLDVLALVALGIALLGGGLALRRRTKLD